MFVRDGKGRDGRVVDVVNPAAQGVKVDAAVWRRGGEGGVVLALSFVAVSSPESRDTIPAKSGIFLTTAPIKYTQFFMTPAYVTALLPELGQRFLYEPATGAFTHLRAAPPYHRQDERAEKFRCGRLFLKHKSMWLPAHNVAWFFSRGEWPQHHVGFVDGDPANLRADNLAPKRDVTGTSRERKCSVCKNVFRTAAKSQVYCSVACAGVSRAVAPPSREGVRFRNRQRLLAKKYGLTLAAFSKLLTAQGNVCAICKLAPGGSPPVVDHCHTSGRVRGVLCRECNSGIGLLRENPATLRAAAAYIEGA